MKWKLPTKQGALSKARKEVQRAMNVEPGSAVYQANIRESVKDAGEEYIEDGAVKRHNKVVRFRIVILAIPDTDNEVAIVFVRSSRRRLTFPAGDDKAARREELGYLAAAIVDVGPHKGWQKRLNVQIQKFVEGQLNE